jgi:hypothetical protein
MHGIAFRAAMLDRPDEATRKSVAGLQATPKRMARAEAGRTAYGAE